jgi:hypothetical protein
MIKFSIVVNEGDVNSKLIKQSEIGYGPSSKLIDKFGEHVLNNIKNKNINNSSKTKIVFESNNNSSWSDVEWEIDTKQLVVKHRWETIDRAINLALGKNKSLNKNDISRVIVRMPEYMNSK